MENSLKKVAVVGSGGIAQIHVDAIETLQNIKVVAFSDVIIDRANKLAEKFSCKAYSDFTEMLDNEEIDVLHICTPHYLHVPMAIEALKRGINVLCEKPVATNAKELDELKIAVGKSTAQFGVCFQNRYLPSSKMAYELINSGKAGKVLGTRGIVTWYRTEEYYTKSGWRGSLKTECGGVMINQAIHTLDLMIWLAGKPVLVEGKINNHHLKGIIEVEDTAEIFLDLGNDVRGIFFASNANLKDISPTLDIWCEHMHILLSGEEIFVDGVLMETEKLPAAIGKMCWGVGHKLLIEDFYKKLDNDDKFPVTLDEASHSVKAIFDLYKSSKG